MSGGAGDSATAPPIVERPLLLLDYDGTIAEITDDPDDAVPHARAPALLRELAARFPVRVITGRRVVDVGRLLKVPELIALGVHGMEEGRLDGTTGGASGGAVSSRLAESDARLLEQVREMLPSVAGGSVAGVRVEDKGAAIALHYRGATDEERVLGELRRWSERLPAELETVWGKKIVEVRPRGYDKGRAARELAAEYPEATPVMIGDDTTDEDAFRALCENAANCVTIKVGSGDSAARYRLADVEAVVAYLSSYLAV